MRSKTVAISIGFFCFSLSAGIPPALDTAKNGKPTPHVNSVTLEALTPNIGGAGGTQANSGKNGIIFVVGSADITVTDLARWTTSGNSTTHTLHLRNSSCVDLATVTVNASLGTPGAYQYGSITPTVLTHGQTYYVQDETNGTDTYYVNVPVTFTGDISSVSEAYDVGGGCNTTSANQSYTPVNFKYHL